MILKSHQHNWREKRGGEEGRERTDLQRLQISSSQPNCKNFWRGLKQSREARRGGEKNVVLNKNFWRNRVFISLASALFTKHKSHVCHKDRTLNKLKDQLGSMRVEKANFIQWYIVDMK